MFRSPFFMEPAVILEVFHTETTPAHELRQRVTAILVAAGEPPPLSPEMLQSMVRNLNAKQEKPIG